MLIFIKTKYQTILLLALCVLMLSCEKITNVQVMDSVNTGNLNYKLNDDSGKGLAGVKVSVYNSQTSGGFSSPNPNALFETVLTDQDGIAHFSGMLPRNYLVTTDSPIVNMVKYRTHDFVQVVADVTKEKMIKVSEFSGILNIRLISSTDYRTPLKNIGIAVHPINGIRINSVNVEDVIKAIPLKGITDENGLVSIKVPSNISFDFILYHPTNRNISWGLGNELIQKEEKRVVTLYASPL